MNVRLAAPLQTDSIVDGEGIRAVVWMQGCSHNCKGCHNPGTHSFKGGYEVDIDEVKTEIDQLSFTDGITLSGGDPLFQIEASLEIAKYAKLKKLNVWCYTGYTFEQLLVMSHHNDRLLELLKNIDVLVDGKFDIEQFSMNVAFRGSKNQRIIDVASSLEQNKAIEIEKYKNRNNEGHLKLEEAIFI